jgi:hypothetical protein
MAELVRCGGTIGVALVTVVGVAACSGDPVGGGQADGGAAADAAGPSIDCFGLCDLAYGGEVWLEHATDMTGAITSRLTGFFIDGSRPARYPEFPAIDTCRAIRADHLWPWGLPAIRSYLDIGAVTLRGPAGEVAIEGAAPAVDFLGRSQWTDGTHKQRRALSSGESFAWTLLHPDRNKRPAFLLPWSGRTRAGHGNRSLRRRNLRSSRHGRAWRPRDGPRCCCGTGPSRRKPGAVL